MPILPALAIQFQCLFPATESGEERWRWFMLTVQAILVPITASRTSNLLRAIATLFGVQIAPSRYYTFMASVKRRWGSVWEVLWRAIPNPLTEGRLLVALDDSGKCQGSCPLRSSAAGSRETSGWGSAGARRSGPHHGYGGSRAVGKGARCRVRRPGASGLGAG